MSLSSSLLISSDLPFVNSPTVLCFFTFLGFRFLSNEAYSVDYAEYYEPYIVARRSAVPDYDPRFRGYGLNKISHLYAVHKVERTFCWYRLYLLFSPSLMCLFSTLRHALPDVSLYSLRSLSSV